MMRQRLGQIVVMTGLVAIMAAPAWAGRGGGNGGEQGRGGGWEVSPSNKQSAEDATRGLERAEQRRAEQAGEHARSGEHDMDMQKEKMKEKAKAKGDETTEKYDRDRDRDRDMDKTKNKAQEDKMTGNGKGEQAPDEAASGKKRWWWPFNK